MDGGKARLLKLRENPAVQMMGIMDEDGNIDIDRALRSANRRAKLRPSVREALSST